MSYPVSTKQRLSVAVFEDDRDTALVYREVFEGAGFDINVFDDAHDCQKFICIRNPDLIILDIISDYGSGGLPLLRQLRTEMGKKLPFVVLATGVPGYVISEIKHSDLRNLPNDSDVYRKPFDIYEMMQKINRRWERNHPA